MKPLGKAIRTARVENRNWVQELSRFLLSYRTTPHSSTNIPPAQLLFNRPVRGTLPMLNPRDKVLNRHKEVKTNDVMAKTRARHYANERRHAKTSNLEVGDKVLLKQRKRNKFTTKFQLEPYTVIERKGTRIVAENERHTITRNASFFKKIKEGMRESDEDEVFNRRATMTELNNGTQAPINNHVEEPGIRRSSRNRIQREQYGNPINPDLVIR